MSGPMRVILALSALAVGVAGIVTWTQREAESRTAEPAAVGGPTEPAARGTAREASWPAPALSYTAIADRNVFRPLVAAPGGPAGAPPPPSTVAKEPPADGRAGKVPSIGPTPPRPGDPLADLALTGVTEAGGALRALIERVSTRTGRYVIVGDEIEGFRVKAVQATAVTLEKGGREYTLRMGAKDMPSAPTPSAPARESGGPPPASPEASRPAAGPTGGGGWDANMLAWAERMSLPDLERAYASYRDRLSLDQRVQAEEYLARRRARGY